MYILYTKYWYLRFTLVCGILYNNMPEKGAMLWITMNRIRRVTERV